MLYPSVAYFWCECRELGKNACQCKFDAHCSSVLGCARTAWSTCFLFSSVDTIGSLYLLRLERAVRYRGRIYAMHFDEKLTCITPLFICHQYLSTMFQAYFLQIIHCIFEKNFSIESDYTCLCFYPSVHAFI